MYKCLRMTGAIAIVLMVIISGSMAVVAQGPEFTANATPPARESDAPVQIGLRGDGQIDGERLRIELAPGEGYDGSVFLGNSGADDVRLVVFTSNLTPKVNGGLSMEDRGSELRAPASWMDFPTEEMVVVPETEVKKTFTIEVPDNTAPGEYVVPIAAETLDSFAVPGSEQIRQKIRKVIAVYIVVPGDYQASFTFGNPQINYNNRGPAIEIPITNTGGTSLRLMGNLTLSDADGKKLVDTTVVLGTFYTGQETTVRTQLTGTLAEGDYTLSLDLSDRDTEQSNGVKGALVTAPEPPSNEVVPLALGNVLILPNADPIQFASVVVEIQNNAEVLRSTRLTLVVQKDGKDLEEFPLAENMTLEQGITTVSQRYLPLTGWTSGDYTFSIRLESVDSSGGASLLLSQDDSGMITVP